jgi:hypothetical protein
MKYDANKADQEVFKKAYEALPEYMKAESERIKKEEGREIKLTKDPIKLASNFNQDFTSLGQYTTSIAETVFNQVMTMSTTIDPILSRVKGMFQDSQMVWFNIRSAQAGLAKGGGFSNPISSRPTTSRSAFSASTGFFGTRVNLSTDELTLYRQTETLDGTYAPEGLRRAISQAVIDMYQRQRLVVARTITNNQYTYYDNGQIQDILSYGRLSKNEFDFNVSSTYWQDINTNTGVVTDNTNANPIKDLLDLFTNPNNTVIQQTLPYLKALVMNPQQARIFTKVALNTGNTLEAISFMSALNEKGYDAESVIKSNIPALENVDIIVYDGRVNLSVEDTFGTIDDNEYIIPTGYIIPIIDYQDVGMGTMLFTPEPRAEYMYGSAPLPTGALGVSDSRSAYMRVLDSTQDPTAETPYMSVEAGARYAYVNPIAPSTSYIIKTFKTSP